MANGISRFLAQFFGASPARDVTAGPPERLASPGNPYPSYSETVLQLDKAYRGTASWGGIIAANVIDVRAAFMLGEGVQPVPAEGVNAKDAARELAFLRSFLRWNELDLEEALNWAREAEIEGKFCVVLKAEVDPAGRRRISARFLPWTAHRYTVETDPADYAVYTGVTYRPNNTGPEVFLPAGEFVFRPFGGRTHIVNEPTPKAGLVLRAMEALDKALVDWREINHLHASPFPWIKPANESAAEKLRQKLAEIRWKVGKALITDAEVQMVGAPTGGIDSLEREITTNAKLISGQTGVAAHFLGFPDLLSNRSTSDNLFEATTVSVRRERMIWKGFYEELFRTAILMANAQHQAGLNPDLVTAQIAEADKARLEMLASVWLPLYQGGALSLRSLLEKIPGVDPEAEEKAITAAAAKRAKDMMQQFGTHGAEEDPDENAA